MTEREIFESRWIKYPYLWRNNRGMAYQGKITRVKKDVMIENASMIKFGIPEPCKGELMAGGDYIGFREITITPDMVGKKIAQFMNVEIKTKTDTVKPNQKKWHEFILEKGGYSEFWKENT